MAEEQPSRRFGKQARILERLGPADAPDAISRLTIAAFDIPAEFPAAALAEADAARSRTARSSPKGRADLRELALVTIDGEDARDFDDAVWAEPDRTRQIAAAGISSSRSPMSRPMSRPGARSTARRRGAATRSISRTASCRCCPRRCRTICARCGRGRTGPASRRCCGSIRQGRKRRHRFERAVMRSAARLTYEAVQAAHDGGGDTLPLAPERLDALYGAFAALDRARRARGALELDLAEHRVVLDEDRRPIAVVPRARLDSHRLIEEFMILANVAAAEELEARHQACMYRVHDPPDPEKLAALRDFLDEIGIPGLALAKGQVIRPELFNRILARAAETPEREIVNELVLRSQAQAVYSPNNIGHFGLALPRYAHFTSPIRRYADLLVHRALVARRRAGREAGDSLGAIAEHISATERRAAAAERSALDRYRASLLGGAIGTVSRRGSPGWRRSALFVTLPETGADGLVPISTLPSDYYDHDAARHRLVGRRTGRIFALGDAVTRPWWRRIRSAAGWCSGSTIIRLPVTPRRSGPIAGRRGYRRRR